MTIMGTCFTFLLTLGSFHIPKLDTILYNYHLGESLNLSVEADVLPFDLNHLQFDLSNESILVKFGAPLSLTADFLVEVAILTLWDFKEDLKLEVELQQGSSMGLNISLDDSCNLIETHPVCNLSFSKIHFSSHQEIPELLGEFLNGIISPEFIEAEICLPLLTFVQERIASKQTSLALPLAATDNQLVISKSKLLVGLLNVVQSLPEIDGMKLTAKAISNHVIHMGVMLNTDVDFQNNFLQLHLPKGLSISTDASLSGNCTDWDDSYAGCTFTNVSFNDVGIQDGGILNLLLHSDGNLLNMLVKFLPIFPVTFGMHLDTENQLPDLRIFLPLSLFLLLGTPILWYFASYRRTRHETPSGVPLTTLAKRLMVIDFIFSVIASITMITFLWSNLVPANNMIIGNTMDFYKFTLSKSIKRLWNADLQWVSVLIFLFSGFYPYWKLVVLIYSVVVRRRCRSLGLVLTDLLSKFSLFDTFMTLELGLTLSIKGVVVVALTPSMYGYICATLMSIILGNFATNVMARLRFARNLELAEYKKSREMEVAVASRKGFTEPFGGGNVDPLERSEFFLSSSSNEDQKTDCKKPVFLMPRKTIIKPLVMVPLLVVAIVCCGIYMIVPMFQFEFQGLATLVMGTKKAISIWDLCLTSVWFLSFVVVLTVGLAPIVLAATFPFVPLAAAWFASDAFILSAIAGFGPGQKIIEAMMPDGFLEVVHMKGKVLWPIYFLGVSMLVSILFTIRYVARV